MIKKFEIWIEGYRATGESATAAKLGEYNAEDFDGAMRQYMDENLHVVDVHKVPKNIKSVKDSSFSKWYSIWACKIYDNEKDARKSLG